MVSSPDAPPGRGCARLARLERQPEAAGGLIGVLPVEGGQDLVGRLHRRVPALRRGELDGQLGGAPPLDPGDPIPRFSSSASRYPGPLDLGFEGLVHVHAEDEMDPTLEIQPQVDRLVGRIQVPDATTTTTTTRAMRPPS